MLIGIGVVLAPTALRADQCVDLNGIDITTSDRSDDMASQGLDFSGVVLDHCKFSYRTFIEGKFDNARLDRVRFVAGNLRGASFVNAVISSSSMGRALLDDANLSTATLDFVQFSRASMTNADLSGVRATKLYAEGVNFSGATLDRMTAEHAIFFGREFHRCFSARGAPVAFTNRRRRVCWRINARRRTRRRLRGS